MNSIYVLLFLYHNDNVFKLKHQDLFNATLTSLTIVYKFYHTVFYAYEEKGLTKHVIHDTSSKSSY